VILGVSAAVRGELSNHENALDTVLDEKGILSRRTVLGTEISVDQKLGRNEFLHGSPAPRIKLETYTTPAIEKGGLFFVHSDHAGPKLLGGVLPILFTELQIEGRQGVFSENFDAPVESLFRLAPGALFKNAQAL
jgi:hypothetical protein